MFHFADLGKQPVRRRATARPTVARSVLPSRSMVAGQDAYFVTGGTGFIGRHVIEALLARPRTRVFVLVREASLGRFRQDLGRWNGDGGRVVPVVGDLVAPRFGIPSRRLAELRGTIGHFVHLGGLYDMTAGADALERVNVDGTAHAVDVAGVLEAHRFHHVSSIAAAGRYPGTFREDMFDEARGLDDPYFRTKHESERIVRAACTVPWRIYRPSLVVGHSETGETDKTDGPYYFFPFLAWLGALLPAFATLPGIDGGFLNLVPVDFVAAAIDRIAHLDGLDGKTFHLVDPVTRTVGETIDVFAAAAGAPRLSLRAPGVERTVRAFLHLFANDRTGLVACVVGIPPRVLAYVGNPTVFDCRETVRVLAGSGIAVPPLEAYARQLWQYWERNVHVDASHPHALERAVRGKNVLVTGASSGIGRATAIKLGAAGAHVILVARRVDRLEETGRLVQGMGGHASVFPTDLTDAESVERLCRTVNEQLGGVDVLVNDAGRSIRRSLGLSEARFHDFQRTMEVNYFGALRLILGLLPAMRARGGGHIVNVSSMGTQVGPPRFSAYVASKAALDGFSRCAAPELLGDGIDITTIYMPLVKTEMIAPTRLYESFSPISAARAADMICSAIVRRPKQVSTLLGLMGQVTASLAPTVVDVALYLAYRLFPDSAAARGETPHNEEQPGSLGKAFAHLLPGVHW